VRMSQTNRVLKNMLVQTSDLLHEWNRWRHLGAHNAARGPNRQKNQQPQSEDSALVEGVEECTRAA
jgi:hypothetical protein